MADELTVRTTIMATMIGRCEVGEDNEYANNEMILGSFWACVCVSARDITIEAVNQIEQ